MDRRIDSMARQLIPISNWKVLATKTTGVCVTLLQTSSTIIRRENPGWWIKDTRVHSIMTGSDASLNILFG